MLERKQAKKTQNTVVKKTALDSKAAIFRNQSVLRENSVKVSGDKLKQYTS